MTRPLLCLLALGCGTSAAVSPPDGPVAGGPDAASPDGRAVTIPDAPPLPDAQACQPLGAGDQLDLAVPFQRLTGTVTVAGVPSRLKLYDGELFLVHVASGHRLWLTSSFLGQFDLLVPPGVYDVYYA